MKKDKIQSIISEEKIFTTGSGVKLNYSFVPALATRLFSDYMQKSLAYAPRVFKLQEQLQDEEFKKDLLASNERVTQFNEENSFLKEDGEAINALGMKIILMILERNDQPIKVTEENVLMEMDLNDMNDFLRITCSTSKDQKKK